VENSFDVREAEIANIKLLNFEASFVFLREINPALQESDTITASVNFMKNNLHLVFQPAENMEIMPVPLFQ